MPDFSKAKYASYIQLCRELRLKRPGQAGDWFQFYDLGVDPPETVLELIDKHPGTPWWGEQFSDEGEAIWLPTLADWLEMLEVAGVLSVELSGAWNEDYENGTRCYIATWRTRDAIGSTREEAAARLWLDLSSD